MDRENGLGYLYTTAHRKLVVCGVVPLSGTPCNLASLDCGVVRDPLVGTPCFLAALECGVVYQTLGVWRHRSACQVPSQGGLGVGKSLRREVYTWQAVRCFGTNLFGKGDTVARGKVNPPQSDGIIEDEEGTWLVCAGPCALAEAVEVWCGVNDVHLPGDNKELTELVDQLFAALRMGNGADV